MTNKVLAENLYKALKQVKRTKLYALPVLNHVRLAFVNGEIELTTTDLDTVSKSKCASIMNEEWSTCVPLMLRANTHHDEHGNQTRKEHKYKYYPFLDYVKVHAEYQDVLEMEFNPDLQILTITCGRSKTEFKCLDAQEFPS